MNSIKRSVKSLENGLEMVVGSFAPNNTSAVAASSVRGQGFSVARSAAGVFVITLSKEYKELVSMNGSVQLSTAADMQIQFGDYVAADKTLVIRSVAGATETDIAADANNRISFVLMLKRTESN